MIKHTGQFVINLTTEELAKATDYCGVKSGRDEDKFTSNESTKEEAKYVAAPLIKESPVNIECGVLEITHRELTTCFWQRFYVFMLMKNIWILKESLIWQWQHCWLFPRTVLWSRKKLGRFGFSVRKKQKEKIRIRRLKIMSKSSDNIILIGMPGVGKSTVGVVLAKVLGYSFIDSDLVIQEKTGRLLKDIIAEEGTEKFKEIENDANKPFNTTKAIIATGGSEAWSGGNGSILQKLEPLCIWN